jgi:predicted TIM-barrel fold metal-dependent hydrolase
MLAVLFSALRTLVLAIAVVLPCGAAAQPAPGPYTGPIIDVHLHTDPPDSLAGQPNPVTGTAAVAAGEALRDATIAAMDRHNVVLAVLNGYPATLESWLEAYPERFIAAVMPFRNAKTPLIAPEELRRQIADGEADMIGEMLGQYVGFAPADPALEPFWALAEELDVPVMVHMGTSAAGTAYAGYPAFRVALGNPMLLEDVLVRHPRVRIWIAHGGAAWVHQTFDLMQQYPQLYMDISTSSWIVGEAGRPGFHAFLLQAIARGLGKRIMFGSDQMAWPDAIGLAIEAVDSAPFLTPEQKRDIFHDNAARFLRLDESER